MFRSYARKLQADRFREVQAKLATMSLKEQFKLLSKLIVEEREQRMFRKYRSHYTIITLDMTQADSYGVPKLTISQNSKTMAFPHKVRVHFKGSYEGRSYRADLGGFNMTQTRGW